MKLHSTQVAREAVETWGNRLTFENLFPESGRLKEVTVISAYTDLAMLWRVCEESVNRSDGRSRVRIRLFLDRLASTYETSAGVAKEINKLDKFLKKKTSAESGIWLVKIGALFHSKAVVLESNTRIKFMLGSLNMTEKAFSKNEELVLLGEASSKSLARDCQIARWISVEYADALKDKSFQVPYKPVSGGHSTLQGLMLSGLMFHEVRESDPFRFDFGLPSDFRRINQSVHPLMEGELKDSISIESIVIGEKNNDGLEIKLPEIDKDGGRDSWKKFCLDTCYGYWCPSLLREDTLKTIESKKRARKPKFIGNETREGLFETVKNRRNEITGCFQIILKGLDKRILENDKISAPDWNVKEVTGRWDSWYDRLLLKLENREICKRIVLGVSEAPVPNVWSDPLTSRKFEESFIDSLQFQFSRGAGKAAGGGKKLLVTLKEAYKFDRDTIINGDHKAVLAHLEQCLSSAATDDNINN